MRFWNNLSKHRSAEVGLGCSGTKTVAHARPSKLLTQPLMKEAKQWVGFSWTEPFFCPQLLRGGTRGGWRRRLCFPVFSQWNRHHTAVVIRGGCGVTVLPFWQCNQSHPREHMVEIIAYRVHPCIMSVLLSLTCYLCKQRLHLVLWHTVYIHRTRCLLKMKNAGAGDGKTNTFPALCSSLQVCALVHACLTQQLWEYRVDWQ